MPTPSIAATELLLDARAFPPGWIVDPCEHYCDPGLIEAVRTFGVVGVPGHVIQSVYYLGDDRAAHAKFQTYRDSGFGKARNRSPRSEFLPPPEIPYRGPIADEQHLGCGVDVVPACQAILRYGSYFVEFYFDIDSGYADGVEIQTDEGLTIEQVEPILRAMDERAAQVFGVAFPSDED